MMLCKADFEELFPDLFKPIRHPVEGTTADAPSAACIARWEDDGGRHCSQLHRREAPVVRPANDGNPVPDLMRTSLAFAPFPAAAAYGAAWVMLSNFGLIPRD